MSARIWAARALILVVFLVNVQCALLFIAFPDRFAPGFELEGAAGRGAVQGFGILFLMWNIPYGVALSHPVNRRVSLYEATAMQATGFAGECLLLAGFPNGHSLIRETVSRFILFDGVGLVLLLLALTLTVKVRTGSSARK